MQLQSALLLLGNDPFIAKIKLNFSFQDAKQFLAVSIFLRIGMDFPYSDIARS